jgi:hypothetical protein
MGKLHQLLAVESDLKESLKLVMEETTKVFSSKHDLFFGSHRKYKPFDSEDNTEYPEDNSEMGSTVADRLAYTKGFVTPYIDAVLQKESTNQNAKAAIEIDGKPITGELPATFLLGLESRLKELRGVYKAIPTLSQGVKWEPATNIGENVFKMSNPEKKLKTAKTFRHQILVEATEHHPAQVEKWDDTKDVGIYEKNIWSGLVTSATKAKLLKRIDTLIVAVKKARQKANNVDVSKVNVAEDLFNYIHG